jgi:hypothetical protein
LERKERGGMKVRERIKEIEKKRVEKEIKKQRERK